MKELTKQRQVKVNTIQDKEKKCLNEEKYVINRTIQDVINRTMQDVITELCKTSSTELYKTSSTELYNFQTKGDPSVLARQDSSNEDDFPILCEEVETAVRSLKNGKAGNDNVKEGKRSGDRHPHQHLQRNLADWRVANNMDSITDNYSSQERKPTTMSELNRESH